MPPLDPTLVSLFVQVPLVAAFMWFSLEQTKRYTQADEKRDGEWRDFMREQREQNNAAISRIAEETKALAMQISGMNAVLIAHDVRASQAIATLTKNL